MLWRGEPHARVQRTAWTAVMIAAGVGIGNRDRVCNEKAIATRNAFADLNERDQHE